MIRAEEAVRRSTGVAGPPLLAVEAHATPHVRLGMAWAITVVGAVLGGPGWLAVWLAAASAVAAGQLARAWRRKGARPVQLVAMAAAGGLPLAALGGADVMATVVVGALLLTLVARVLRSLGPDAALGAPTRDVAFTL